jgi:L-amino acid N-acyltransferase YncA
MDIRLQSIAREDRRAVIDLFNHYVEHGFAAFAETPLPYGFFERFIDMTAGLPTLTAKNAVGELLAFGLLRPHSPWSTTSHVAEITYFVVPSQTRQGIGSRLLAELERQAKPCGIRIFLASISSLNEPSLAFHRKHGFTEVGRFKTICVKHGTPFDSVWMEKIL